MHQTKGWLRWHLLLVTILFLLVLPVLVTPLYRIATQPEAWKVWTDAGRIAAACSSSLVLMLGSATVALLLGLPAAWLVFRTKLSGRRAFQFLLFVALFLPMPLILTGWQNLFQFLELPAIATWKLGYRIVGVTLLHGLEAVPLAFFCIGLGFLLVEKELEEEAIISIGTLRTFLFVVLPRCKPMLILTGLLVALRSWNEISLTDFFQVISFAEEIYLQLVAGNGESDTEPLIMTLPVVFLFLIVLINQIRSWKQSFQPRLTESWANRKYPVRFKTFSYLLLILLVAASLGIPILGLLQQAGKVGQGWSLGRLLQTCVIGFSKYYPLLLQTLLLGLLTVGCLLLSSLLFLWMARRHRRWESLLWLLIAILLCIPAPLLGFALLDWFRFLIDFPATSFTRPILWDGPSLLPNLWIAVLRYLPFCWLLGWFFSQQIPKQIDEAAELDGCQPSMHLFHIYWPMLRGSLLWISTAAALFSLAELSASKIVTTPGYNTLSLHIFNQLHSGADNEVAALGLVLLFPVVVVASLLWFLSSSVLSRPR